MEKQTEKLTKFIISCEEQNIPLYLIEEQTTLVRDAIKNLDFEAGADVEVNNSHCVVNCEYIKEIN